MNTKLILLCLVLCSTYVAARDEFIIDNFSPSQPSFRIEQAAGSPPETDSLTQTGDADTIGGARDLTGEISSGAAGGRLVLSVVQESFNIAYPQTSTGFVEVIWDGAGDTDPAAVDVSPGLGGIDFLRNGAFSLQFVVSADHAVNYTFSFYSGSDVSSLTVMVPESVPVDLEQTFLLDFDDFVGTADLTNVDAVQMRADTIDSVGLDTVVSLLSVFTYEICGFVFGDCNENGIMEMTEVFLPGITATATSSTVSDSTLSDANGSFCFTGFRDGTTLTVCVDDLSDPNNIPTIPASGCTTVTLSDAVDPEVLPFGMNVPSGVSAPDDVDLQCGESTLPANTGFATTTGCVVGTATFSDVSSGNTCLETITRVWFFADDSDAQIITVTDGADPFFTVTPTGQTDSCESADINAWVTDNADATCSDACNTVSIVNNFAGSNPSPCGDEDVAFFCRDACGNTNDAITVTYTVFDNTPPTIDTPAANQSAACGSSANSAYATWLADNGGSRASDNCSAVTVTDDRPASGITNGCSGGVPVTWFYTDFCGNESETAATFSIIDNTAPIWNPTPSDDVGECNDQDDYDNWVATRGNIGNASDACTAVTFTNNAPGNAPVGCNIPVVVQFTASDECGNSAVETATYTVQDTVSPVLNGNAVPLVVDCTDSTAAATTQTWLNSVAETNPTDSCSGLSITNDFEDGNLDCSDGPAPVQFTVCDACNNCRIVSSTISVQDNNAPTFVTTPVTQTEQCDDNVQAEYEAWISTTGGATINDDCTAPQNIIVGNNAGSTPTVSTGCDQDNLVTFSARDACGNTSTATGLFTVIDTIAPSMTNAVNVDEQCDGQGTTNQSSFDQWKSTSASIAVTDFCSGFSITNDGPNDLTLDSCVNTVAVTFFATDVCGNQNSEVGTYTVRDSTPPTITREATDITDECEGADIDGDLQAWLNSNGNAAAIDDCSAVTFTNNFNALSGGCTQSALVTFTASDECGNQATTAGTFSVSDNSPPIITRQASNDSEQCDEDTAAAFTAFLNTAGGATATDACQDDSTISITNNAGDVANIQCGGETVTFFFSDACGQTVSTTAVFSVLDSEDPVFDPAPTDTVAECDGSGNTADYNTFVNTNAGATVQDNCALTITQTNNAAAAGPTTCGSVSVVFQAADECGNTVSDSATFTVADTAAPFFTVLPTNPSVQCDSTNGNAISDYVAAFGNAVAADICDSDPSLSVSQPSITGDSCIQSRTYTFTASDNCGGSTVETGVFTVFDSNPPTFTEDPEDVTFECNGAGNTNDVQTWLNANGNGAATDSCNAVTISNNFVEAPAACSTQRITFTAADTCGNAVSRDAFLEIDDSTDPTFVDFPADLEIPCDSATDVGTTGSPGVADSCYAASDLSLFNSETFFTETTDTDCPGDIIMTRTFIVTDPCGNSATRAQNVTIRVARSSGPCDPVGCECDGCCPLSAPALCLASDCQATPCASSPCQASDCTCANGKNVHPEFSLERLSEPLPQCEPVYIYVYDDDDAQNTENDLEKPLFVSDRELELNNRRTRRTRTTGRKALPAADANQAKSWFDQLFE